MPVNHGAWREVLVTAVEGIADEPMQRRSWFGEGPEESSPDEDINQLLGDASLGDFLLRSDTGLTEMQRATGEALLEKVKQFCDATPSHLDPFEVIDDPRWIKIRAAATAFAQLLRLETT